MATITITFVGYVNLFPAFVFVFVVAREAVWKHSSLPLPPGPRRIPLIGNLFNMPIAKEWETFAKWGERYGKLVALDFFVYVVLSIFVLIVGDIISVTGVYHSSCMVASIPSGL